MLYLSKRYSATGMYCSVSKQASTSLAIFGSYFVLLLASLSSTLAGCHTPSKIARPLSRPNGFSLAIFEGVWQTDSALEREDSWRFQHEEE